MSGIKHDTSAHFGPLSPLFLSVSPSPPSSSSPQSSLTKKCKGFVLYTLIPYLAWFILNFLTKGYILNMSHQNSKYVIAVSHMLNSTYHHLGLVLFHNYELKIQVQAFCKCTHAFYCFVLHHCHVTLHRCLPSSVALVQVNITSDLNLHFYFQTCTEVYFVMGLPVQIMFLQWLSVSLPDWP